MKQRQDNTAEGHADLVLSKEEINNLPLRSFPGAIHLIDPADASPAAAGWLRRLERTRAVIGLDTESRPSFKKGEHHPICLIQLATRQEAYLFQVRQGMFPDQLKRIIENRAVVKIVQGAAQELQDLVRDHGVRGAAFFDLPAAAKECGCAPRSLRGLTAIFLGFRVSKSAQRSNWEQSRLTDKQLAYAATDAWAPLMIYEQMRRRRLISGRIKTLDYSEPPPGGNNAKSRRRRSRPRHAQAPPASRI
jgi:ribonuclease D